MQNIVSGIYNVGATNKELDMFESQYSVKNGMEYNSYLIVDEKVVLFETIDEALTDKWLENIATVLGDRKIDYLVISHMEPDHSANIMKIKQMYKDVIIVGNVKTFQFMSQFFNRAFEENILVVKEGDVLDVGAHKLQFINAPMCHWPEVIMTYDSTSKILFSADAFGKFGANDVKDNWDDEARRYYYNIVGKYGVQVQSLLKKVSALDIQIICPLHGNVLTENLSHYISLYDTWSKYESEVEGVFIAYTSVYGNTRKACEKLAIMLSAKGIQVEICDLSRSDSSWNLEKAFKYSKIVFATTTYNAGIFPPMEDFLHHIKAKNMQNKKIGIIENGTWVPMAGKGILEILNSLKNLQILEPMVTIKSALNDVSQTKLEELADSLSK